MRLGWLEIFLDIGRNFPQFFLPTRSSCLSISLLPYIFPFLLSISSLSFSLSKPDNSLLFDRRLGQIVTEFGQSFFKIIFKLEYVVFTSIFTSLSVDTIFIRAKKLVKPPRFVFLFLMPRFSTLGNWIIYANIYIRSRNRVPTSSSSGRITFIGRRTNETHPSTRNYYYYCCYYYYAHTDEWTVSITNCNYTLFID